MPTTQTWAPRQTHRTIRVPPGEVEPLPIWAGDVPCAICGRVGLKSLRPWLIGDKPFCGACAHIVARIAWRRWRVAAGVPQRGRKVAW